MKDLSAPTGAPSSGDTSSLLTDRSPRTSPALLLCLTCSSSPSPKLLSSSETFLTPCCSRLICNTCLSRNPRLRVYDPCLACLGGVDASSRGKRLARAQALAGGSASGRDPDERVEEVLFVVGDDEDEEEQEQGEESGPPPYSYSSVDEPLLRDTAPTPAAASNGHSSLPLPSPSVREDTRRNAPAIPPTPTPTASSSDRTKYYIQPGDTLSAISLKLGIDGRRLARLNNLPPSVLSTTPHLLHTRRFLTLPNNARTTNPHPLGNNAPQPDSIDVDAEALAQREKERKRELAEKRFAFVTKEVDYRVAKAYVAVADEFSSDDDKEAWASKEGPRASREALKQRVGDTNVESRAVGLYLEDEEWEARELKAGRAPRPDGFLFVGSTSSSGTRGSSRRKS